MTKQTEALKLALEALESCIAGDYSTGHVIHPSFDVDAVNKAIESIDALAEQPAQQEPVTDDMTADRAEFFMRRFKHEEKLLGPNEQAALDFVIAMLASPPAQRTWVGLTDDDYRELHLEMGPTYFYQDYGRAIEAKLKEKNSG